MKNLVVSGLFYLYFAEQALAESAGHGAAHEDAGHHSSGGLPQLDPSTFASQIFWLLIIFTILYFFFSKKTLPEISGIMQNRQERIQTDLDSAETLRSEVEAVHTAYEDSLSGARAQASKCYADAESTIQKKSEERMDDLRERTEREIKALEEKISASTKEVMGDMEKIAATIAADAAEKIIDIRVSEKEALDVVLALGSPVKKTSKAA